MNSNQLDIFERNRYFYGKLLTAQDFAAEQTYFNNKRRLINRLLFGSGVVCGLDVLAVDEQSVVIESGLALDYGGREIVVPQPQVVKLASLTGFDELKEEADGGLKNTYLCLGYHEKAAEPVHSIAKDVLADENEGREYNKVIEEFSFFLTTGEPEIYPSEPHAAAQSHIMLWEDEDIRLTLAAPRFVNAEQEFYLETRLSKGMSKRAVSFSFTLELEFLSCDGNHIATINFDESGLSETKTRHIRTLLKAHSVCPQTASLRIRDLTITAGGRTVKPEGVRQMNISVVERRGETFLEEQKNRPLQDLLSIERPIYLARLGMRLSPEYYILEHVENLPFSQTVLSSPQAQGLQILESYDLGRETRPITVSQSEPKEINTPSFAQSGIVNVVIPAGAKKGRYYTSVPVAHGLGTGMVFVTVGLQTDDAILFDPNAAFNGNITWGVRVENGVFTIGVKLLGNTPSTTLVFVWTASSVQTTTAPRANSLNLYPSIRYAARREIIRFEATLENGASLRTGELKWSVHPESGGEINDMGVLTVYDQPNFLEIKAQSVVEPNLCASAFVVVQ